VDDIGLAGQPSGASEEHILTGKQTDFA